MAEAITVHCPSCETAFPVDPDKVPGGGVNARCSECSEVFRVDDPAGAASAGFAPGAPETETTGAGTAVEEARTGAVEQESAEPETVEESTADDVEMETVDYFSGGGGEEEAGGDVGLELDEAPQDEDPATSAQAGVEATEAPVEEEVPDAEPGRVGEEVAEEISTPEESETEGEEPAAAPRPTFGQRSPEEKAHRLARVLVSDMITYNPKLYEKATAEGTLKEDFEEEIEKSWEEYVDQVGEDMATSTPYWRDALNEILAKGDDVF